MIRSMTLACALLLSATAALANDNSAPAGAQSAATMQPTGIHMASNMQSDPMDANARMKKRKMRHHMMRHSGSMNQSPMNDGQTSSMGGGMNNGVSGGMNKGAMGGGMSK